MFSIRYESETDSTNDDAARFLGEPGSDGLVLVADYQRAGKGRHDRRWIAPPGSALMFTAILPRSVPADALWSVPFWTALAIADAIETFGPHVGLQWPNDILLDGGKCAGILCISRISGEQAWVGCGVGINVLRPARSSELEQLNPPPAFLSDASSGIERGPLLQAVLSSFARLLDELDRPIDIARAWERRAELHGTIYRLFVDGEATPFEATALRLTADGGLVVDVHGTERTVSLADARVVR